MNKTMAVKRFLIAEFKTLMLCGICLLFCSGCNNLLGLRRDLVRLKKSAEISGKVLIPHDSSHPIFVALYKNEDGERKLYSYWVIYKSGSSGEFNFLVASGEYYLFAFEDKNEDFAFNPDEKIGWYGKPSLLSLKTGETRSGIEITLRKAAQAQAIFPQLYSSSKNAIPIEKSSRHLGRVEDLSETRFGAAYASIGLWQPVKFLEELNSGIFFLQPFNETKIPVLFIHGAGGFPQQWKAMINNLDKSRFQAWILHYPSGLRLDLLGKSLGHYLSELRLNYRFEQIFIVAHSMGGLVARKAINRHQENNEPEFIKLLITISTPWRGHPGAAYGVKQSPLVIPSWYDMAEGSRFLKQLHQTKLSSHLRFYLLFGFRGGSGNTSGDGTVPLRSVLDLDMQEAASKVIGFNENHVSILSSTEVIVKVNQLLNEAAQSRKPKIK